MQKEGVCGESWFSHILSLSACMCVREEEKENREEMGTNDERNANVIQCHGGRNDAEHVPDGRCHRAEVLEDGAEGAAEFWRMQERQRV